jgi:hypothetical protein
MTKRGLALIVLLLASGATPAEPQDRGAPPKRIERSPDFVLKVNDAIDTGVLWLKKRQASDGSFPDFPQFPGAVTALAYYTMRVCGVPKEDPAAKAAWTSLKNAYHRSEMKTYSAAVYLMAIAEHGERVKDARDEHDVKLSKDEMKWAEEIARALAGGQDERGAWSYLIEGSSVPGGLQQLPEGYDHSNLQYALLGLKAAARCGVKIDPAVWRKSLVHLLETQQASGLPVDRGAAPVAKGATSAKLVDHARGWCYRGRAATPDGGEPGLPPLAGMTAGCVGSVVICRSELAGTREMTDKLDADAERAVWDGLAWLGTSWVPTGTLTPPTNLPPRIRDALGTGISLYEFYAVERAGILAGAEWMGPTDWYGAGVASLLERRTPDGSWTGYDAGLVVEDLPERKSAYRPVDTCFALLFLRRGTVPVRRGAVTGGGDDSDLNFAEAAKLTGRDLEDFLEVVLSRWRRTKDEAVKKRLFDGATSAGPRIVEPLLVRLDFTDPPRRAAAHALLRHATGMDFGFNADASPAARDDAVMKWQDWWMSAREKLAYDPAAKRLVER